MCQLNRTLAVMLSCFSIPACSWFADTMLNVVVEAPPYKTSVEATTLHQQLTIVDLHADPLLWDRDLLKKSSRGHADVPRLLEGNTTLQVFGVVTGIPFPPKLENNKDKQDVIKLLARSQGWPQETYNSRLQRALYQAEKLSNFSQASDNKLKLIRTKQNLLDLLQERHQGKQVVGALLSLEGAHALEGTVENIDKLYQVGFRMLGLTHYTDNAMAGSTHGIGNIGLSEKGRQLILRSLELGIVIDLSHASVQTIDDVINMVDKPVVASHGGVRGTCDNARNLTDKHIRAIANVGGVIGIGLYKYATCGYTLDDTIQAIQYVVNLVGVNHVALGSDFDGSVATLFDSSGWVTLTEGLLKSGFTSKQIKAIMGDNAIRVLTQVLTDS